MMRSVREQGPLVQAPGVETLASAVPVLQSRPRPADPPIVR